MPNYRRLCSSRFSAALLVLTPHEPGKLRYRRRRSGHRDREHMGKVRSGIAALIEVFLKDVLRLEGETEAQVRERVPIHVAEYERMFRDSQLEEGNKDLAAKVCRALCRRSVIKDMAKRGGTPTEAHLQIVLGSIAPPGFSSKDYADAPPISPALDDR